MELQWIDDFLALEQTRNFTRAADLRATTQSAYSRRIQRLEEWLGVALFERTIRPVTLTVAGEDFLRRARRLREDIMDLRRNALASASGLVQSTRIYTTNTLAAGFFAGWAQQQKLANYALVVASVTACLEALRQHKAQLAIVPAVDGDDGLDPTLGPWDRTVIGRDALVLAVSAKTTPKIILKNKKLCGPLMLYSPGSAYAALVRSALAKQRVTLDAPPLCESASAEALAAQVQAGMGAAWIPESLMTKNMVRVPAGHGMDCAYDILLLKTHTSASSDADAALASLSSANS